MQRKFLSGGVSPRFTRRPKGQSTVEYVLIIAIIGLVIVFAGPGVAGAIRNQFNLVGNTVNSGTAGGVEGGVGDPVDGLGAHFLAIPVEVDGAEGPEGSDGHLADDRK